MMLDQYEADRELNLDGQAAPKALDYSPPILHLLFRMGDLAAVGVSGSLAYYLAMGHWDMPSLYRGVVLMTMLLVLLIFRHFGLYGPLRGRDFAWQVSRIVSASLVVIALLAVLTFFTHTSSLCSRQWVLYACGLMIVSLVGYRSVVDDLLGNARRMGWNEKRVLIVGSGALAQCVIKRLSQADWTGYRVIALAADEAISPSRDLNGLPVHDLHDLSSLVMAKNADEVWITLPIQAQHQIEKVLNDLRTSTAQVRWVPDYLGLRMLARDVTEVAGITVLNFNSSPLSSPASRVLKEIMDRVIASLILLMISPLMLLIAVGVKLSSPGPILFKQLRHGVNGKPIWIYKFRTMKMHEEKPGEVVQAKRDDDRITPFGAFLRRTSLDELPQFINVLQGRMSIVGPRPHAVEHNEFYQKQMETYAQRHMVKPGITGWAQVSGWRGETDCLEKMQRRIEHDLYYIEHWTPWLDIKIILQTALHMFIDKNAY